MAAAASRHFVLRRYLTIAFSLPALALCILHWSNTNNFSFSYDMKGHMYYIGQLVHHRELPTPGECWQCWHPPLYYVMAAPFYKAAQFLGLLHPMRAVRLFSFLCYCVFLGFSIRLLHEHLRSNTVYATALALVLFWPLGFAKATLINNDIPLYAAQMAGIYCLSRWWRDPGAGHACNTVICCAIAISFKSSGLVFAGIIAATILARWITTRFEVRVLLKRRFIATLLASVALASPQLIRNYLFFSAQQRPPASILVPNTISLPRHTWILRDSPEYYLTFDFAGYFAGPFSYLSGEWLYFWNGVMKSALFGEHSWGAWRWAAALVYLQMGMLMFLAAGAVYLLRRRLPGRRRHSAQVFIIAVMLELAALMLLRIRSPYICSEDFRYIFPVMPMMALLYGMLIEALEDRGRSNAAMLGAALAGAFSVSAIIFIFKQYA